MYHEHHDESSDRPYIPPRSRTPATEDESLAVHVAVCAERYTGINHRLEKIERALWWMVTSLIMALGGIIVELVFLFVKR